MRMIEEPTTFVILTLLDEFPDWDKRSEYAAKLRSWNYFVEADELENQIQEGDFYDFLQLFEEEHKPKNRQ